MGPHPSVHRHSHAGSRRRPTLRGHGSIPLPATLGGWAASLEKTNACRWRANDLLNLAVQQSPDVEEEHLCAAASAEGEYDARRASSQVDGLRLSIEVLRGTGVGGAKVMTKV